MAVAMLATAKSYVPGGTLVTQRLYPAVAYRAPKTAPTSGRATPICGTPAKIGVPPSSRRTVHVSVPVPPLSLMATRTGPDTVSPSVGLVIDAVGLTVMVRVGGLGSFAPRSSVTVNDTTYVPAVENVTVPGKSAALVPGDPPGKTHEYAATAPSGSFALPAKLIGMPASITTSPSGVMIVPLGALFAGVGDS